MLNPTTLFASGFGQFYFGYDDALLFFDSSVGVQFRLAVNLHCYPDDPTRRHCPTEERQAPVKTREAFNARIAELWHGRTSTSFRGQTVLHPTRRAIKNPYYVRKFGIEPSLEPSAYRTDDLAQREANERRLRVLLDSFRPMFKDIERSFFEAECERLLSDPYKDLFDKHDVDAMDAAEEYLLGQWENGNRKQEAEQAASDYATFCLDALIQQYGGLSCLLDVTNDPDVARYFAAATFQSGSTLSSTRHRGSGVVFAFPCRLHEVSWEFSDVRADPHPERVERQRAGAIDVPLHHPNAALHDVLAIIDVDETVHDDLDGERFDARTRELFPYPGVIGFLYPKEDDFFACLLRMRYMEEPPNGDYLYDLAQHQDRYLAEFLEAFESFLWENHDSVDPALLETARREMTPKKFWSMVRDDFGSLTIDEEAFDAFYESLLPHPCKKAVAINTKGVRRRSKR